MSSELVFRSDVMSVIANFLDPIDIIYCSRIFRPRKSLKSKFIRAVKLVVDIKSLFKCEEKLYRSLMSPILKEHLPFKVDNYFRTLFGDRYSEFRRLMTIDKAVISGSILLQIILNETWEGSDIDIFIPVSNYSLENIPRNTLLFSALQDFLYNFTEGRVAPAGIAPMYVFDADRVIAKIHSYTKINQAPLQTITLRVNRDYDNVMTFIQNSFDLSVCKNGFYYDAQGPKLVLHDVEEIVYKISRCRVTQPRYLCYYRVQKYTNRGFEITVN
jgi:hypothetical protein